MCELLNHSNFVYLQYFEDKYNNYTPTAAQKLGEMCLENMFNVIHQSDSWLLQVNVCAHIGMQIFR
jgi:hypothetical protein